MEKFEVGEVVETECGEATILQHMFDNLIYLCLFLDPSKAGYCCDEYKLSESRVAEFGLRADVPHYAAWYNGELLKKIPSLVQERKPSNQNIICSKCNGTGIRDMELYKRTCECRLG